MAWACICWRSVGLRLILPVSRVAGCSSFSITDKETGRMHPYDALNLLDYSAKGQYACCWAQGSWRV